MSLNEYILSFESILYGLVVSKILVEWNKMLKGKKPVRHYWAYYLLTVDIFLHIIHYFFINFDFERYQAFTNPQSFLVHAVLPPVLFTFMTYQMFPSELKNIDLKEFLHSKIPNIFIPLLVFMIYNAIQLGTPELTSAFIIFYGLIGLLTLAILIRKKRIIESFVMASFISISMAFL